MKVLFTTLAVGEEYFYNALSLYKDLSSRVKCDFNITTDVSDQNIDTDKINIDQFKLNKYSNIDFYYNLKVLSLKYATNKDYDIVIYCDSDWKSTGLLTYDNLINLYNHLNDNELDICLERPSNIGYYKDNWDECFFKQKMIDYEAWDHTLYDDAMVWNEQFMIFKNNNKFRYFTRKWEEKLWYSIANNINNYAEGFEIGISLLEANLKYDTHNWYKYLDNCFYFYDKEKNKYNRF